MGAKIPVRDLPAASMEPSRPITYQPRATPDRTALMALGEGLRKDVAPMLDVLQTAADKERVNVEMKALWEWKREAIDKPETGFLARRLEGAKGITEEVDRAYNEQARQVKDRLKNAQQRRLFDEEFTRDYHRLIGAVSEHEGRELANAGDLALNVKLDAIVDDGKRSVAYGKPVEPVVEDITKEIVAAAPLRGWSADVQKSLVKERVEKLHEGVLDVLINDMKDYTSAETYLTSNKPTMPKAGAKWQKTLDDARKPAEEMEIERRVWDTVERELGLDRPGSRFNEENARFVLDRLVPASDVGRVRNQIEQRVLRARQVQDALDVETVGKIEVEQINRYGRVDKRSREYRGLDWQGRAIVEARELTYQRAQASERTQARVVQNEIDRAFLAEVRAGLTSPDDAERDGWLGKSDADLAKEFPDASGKAISNYKEIRNRMLRGEKKASFGLLKQVRSDLIKSMPNDTLKRAASDEINTWWEEQEGAPDKAALLKKAAEIGAVYVKPEYWGLMTKHVRGAKLTPEEREKLRMAPAEDQKTALARSFVGAAQAQAKQAQDPNLARAKALQAQNPGTIIIRRDGKLRVVAPNRKQPGDVEIK